MSDLIFYSGGKKVFRINSKGSAKPLNPMVNAEVVWIDYSAKEIHLRYKDDIVIIDYLTPEALSKICKGCELEVPRSLFPSLKASLSVLSVISEVSEREASE